LRSEPPSVRVGVSRRPAVSRPAVFVPPRRRGVVIRLDERRGSRERTDQCPAGLWVIVVVTLLSLLWRFLR
jgi:hypothetical protein